MRSRDVDELFAEIRAGRLNRREVLRRGAALGLGAPVLASLLAACGGGGGGTSETAVPTTGGGAAQQTPSGSPGTAPAGQRGQGGLLKLLWWQAPTILNPHLAQGTKDFDAAAVVLEPLADIDINAQLVPKLAAEIPSLENGGVAEDGLSVTWRLKEGVVWSDGEPFTSADVKFTYDYVINEQTTATTVSYYRGIESIETPDDYTVVIHFTDPTPGWFNVFVGPYGMILPEHVLRDYVGEEARNAPFNLMPIGTGPFKVDEFRPGDVVLYSVNDNYREEGKPFFAQVELKGGGDATSAARAAIQTGEVDFAWNLQVQEQVLASLEAEGEGIASVTPGNSVERILVNLSDPRTEVNGERSHLGTPHPWQSDLAVRQAYALAVQRDVIAEQLYGRGGEATPNVLVAPPKFVSQNTSWRFDLEEAGRLLDEAGWVRGPDGIRAKDGVRMEIVYQTTVNPVRQQTQEIVKAAFEQLGISVQLKSIESGVFFSSEAGNPDTAAHFYADLEMFTNNPSSPYPLDYMASWWGDPSNIAQKDNNWSGNNYERWQNDEYDQLYQQANTELDEQRQVELITRMNELVVTDVASIPLVQRNNVQGQAKNLSGLELSPWTSNLWNIANWVRTEG
ncbi:peptide ABC transporter substrate-binding protein [Sphaerobacter sp.]|uniref:peptide ABC transporter substrate-binding protein n=1 Tax=Sphaerobacter sp. TaxID=2099654 RepID=UPI001D6FE668|nr:peptide ABC transporter substrate-binding protein [Sphaerobacter sp.]MBX5444284.1 peptide ABC transporter substrate-binding protein [Sphaerobacter sp.]